MRIARNQIPTKFAVPAATARQIPGFGDATGYGTMGGEYFTIASGTDIAPLLQGLENDACQAPHWGYLISGQVVVTYTDGKIDHCEANDLFFWPAGHSVRALSDTELVMFSPQKEHGEVMDHLIARMGG